MKKAKNKKIRLFEPHIGKEELDEVSKVLKEKFWASGAGINRVKKFEESLSKFTKCGHTIAVNSGTAALHLSLSILNPSKKEVLLPTITFASTAHSILYNNAKPKFVDVNESDLCIDIDDLEKKITKKSSIVIPVHFGGYPCDLDKLNKIRKDYKLHIVEDAAHAFGSSFNGKKIGSHSELVCFSFHPVKNLAMPSGGAISMNSHFNQLKLLKSSRWCGITDRKNGIYEIENIGWSYYMNEISAAIGLIQLKRIKKMNKHRLKIAKRYFNKINVENKMPISSNCSYHLYWIRVKNRDQFRRKMELQGIETGIHYRPLHLMKLYNHNQKLPLSEQIWKELVTLPIHPNLTESELEYIISNVNKFVK